MQHSIIGNNGTVFDYTTATEFSARFQLPSYDSRPGHFKQHHSSVKQWQTYLYFGVPPYVILSRTCQAVHAQPWKTMDNDPKSAEVMGLHDKLTNVTHWSILSDPFYFSILKAALKAFAIFVPLLRMSGYAGLPVSEPEIDNQIKQKGEYTVDMFLPPKPNGRQIQQSLSLRMKTPQDGRSPMLDPMVEGSGVQRSRQDDAIQGGGKRLRPRIRAKFKTTEDPEKTGPWTCCLALSAIDFDARELCATSQVDSPGDSENAPETADHCQHRGEIGNAETDLEMLAVYLSDIIPLSEVPTFLSEFWSTVHAGMEHVSEHLGGTIDALYDKYSDYAVQMMLVHGELDHLRDIASERLSGYSTSTSNT
ncbi:hypothetical protein QFC24_003012 [Naganishia onofrii]|uniref:Uncharacterized protein n=1 Tax=Naganishia onofrii TaxID=1851511 RepID=A0ACC2XKT6_9TREE|nr:hypothetical protein QFC24_003012 [Naganishia onofrii]